MNVRSILTVLCFGALLAPLAALQSPQAPQLEISHRARALEPGEIVLLRVATTQAVENVQGRAFDRRIRFWKAASGWEGLFGIDLSTAPGNYVVTVTARSGAGPHSVEYPVEVASKEFPTRRLTVDPKFVTPPPEVSDRIRRESRLLGEVLSTSSGERYWEGSLTRPVPGEAVSSFGKRSVFNGKPRSPHTGTDFRAGEGTPVLAPAGGRVLLAQDLYYAGNSVIVDHGLGLLSMMAHLSRIDVEQGDLVKPGEQLGLVGATGRVTGPHLHWALRLAGARIDPLSLVEVMTPSATER